MKKSFVSIIFLSLLIMLFVSCSHTQSQVDTPDIVASNFLQALQQQNYASAKTYYAENLDNMANFRNQIEEISPSVANKLFSKMSDFSYTINEVTINPDDSTKANVAATITAYDLGKAFESTVLDYIKTDLEMTFDGATSDDVIKQAEEVIVKDIESSEKTFVSDVTIALTKENDTWKIDKISDNPALLNALSGNIIDTINQLSASLENL